MTAPKTLTLWFETSDGTTLVASENSLRDEKSKFSRNNY